MRDPVLQFQSWFVQALKNPRIDLPEAMCLSTVGPRGTPSARMVLLKEFSGRGFDFFTNMQSAKAAQLKKRPWAALAFHWQPLRRQVRIEGKVESLPKLVADAYFALRPRDSQIASWASKQSAVLTSRQALMNRFKRFAVKFKGKKVPAPPYWQGFRVIPERVEFWQERPNRLHDRWLYVKNRKGRWGLMRLYP